MANNVYDLAHSLARAITESEQYIKYVEAKKIIEQNPEFKEKILELRNKQMEVNRAQMMGEEVSSDKITQVANDFAKLNQIEQIANFFNAEGQFITLFNDIQQIIQKKIEQGFE